MPTTSSWIFSHPPIFQDKNQWCTWTYTTNHLFITIILTCPGCPKLQAENLGSLWFSLMRTHGAHGHTLLDIVQSHAEPKIQPKLGWADSYTQAAPSTWHLHRQMSPLRYSELFLSINWLISQFLLNWGSCIKDKRPYPNQDQDTIPQFGTSSPR